MGNLLSSSFYRTDDLHQAAYIWCHGFEPRLEWAGPGKVTFVFADTSASLLLDEYVRGAARVEPLRFSAALRELKRRAKELAR
jgi:hypothetical protein